VLYAGPSELPQIKDIGPKNIFALRFIQGVARRHLRQRIIGKHYVRSSREVADYLIHSMRGLPHEVLSVIFLDAAHGIIDSTVVTEKARSHRTPSIPANWSKPPWPATPAL